MRWREIASDQPDPDKPLLEAVLRLYGVTVPSRQAFMARCPLHEDSNPSLSVNLGQQVLNCHSCGFGGDSYALLMKMEGVDFVGARKLAADKQLATRATTGSDTDLSPGRFARRGGVPRQERDHPQPRRWRSTRDGD